MIFVFYSEKGVIQRCRENSRAARKYAEENPNYIEADDYPSERAYVDIENKTIVDPGPAPTEGHRFDLDQKQYVFDKDRAKRLKWEEIKRDRDEAERILRWAGYEIDADPISQQRIITAALLARLDPFMKIEWTLADNSSVQFTAEQMENMAFALSQHITEIHQRGRLLRSQVQSAAGQAQLEAITWQSNSII